MRPLSIALLGTRGIPAAYGGFETFAEEISKRLAERGHTVTVYGRRSFFKGSSCDQSFAERIFTRQTPTIFQKYLETPLHSLSSFLDLYRKNYDLVLLCNAANSPFAFLAKPLGVPVVINVDGIERLRKKWNGLGRLWYQLGERSSVWFGTQIVSDADVIADYYQERYGLKTEVIPYGADGKTLPPGETLARYGLRAGEYLLYVSRLEPENNALGVVSAYREVSGDLPLVVVGDAPYASEYISSVKAAADNRVIFTGFLFGDAYRELQSNCALYIQATEVGGTHPALVEAMGRGCAIVANDVPEHREVLADAGWYYPKNGFNELALVLEDVLKDPAARAVRSKAAKERQQERYSWEAVTNRYEEIFKKIAG